MYLPRRFLAIALALLAPMLAGAALSSTAKAAVMPGSPYPAFSPFQQRLGDATGYESATSVAVRGDGRIVAGVVNDAELDRTIVSLRPDGHLDSSFSEDGVWRMPQPNDTIVRAVAALPDGRTLFGGDDSTASTIVIGRLMSDGELDPTFGGGDGLYVFNASAGSAPRVEQLIVEPDGRIAFAGSITVSGKSRQLLLGKLTAAGAADPTFSGSPFATYGAPGTGDVDRLGGFVRMPSGEFILGDAHSTGMTGIWRIGPDGNWSMFKDINLVNTIDEPVDMVALDATHVAAIVTGTPWATALIRLSVDATPTLDTSFGAAGIATPFPATFRGEQLLRQADGKLVVSGFDGSLTTHRAIVRLDADGTADTGFGAGGTVALGGTSMRSASLRLHRIALAADGSIVSASHVGAPSDRIVAIDRLVGRVAHVRVAVSAGTRTPYAKAAVPVVLRVTNDGPDSSGAVSLAINLPPELTVDGTAGATCSTPTAVRAVCSVPSLTSGATRELTVTVRSAEVGARVVSAAIAAGVYDDVTADDESSLAINFTAPPVTVAPVKVSAPTPSDIHKPTPVKPGRPVTPRLLVRRINRYRGHVIGCGIVLRKPCVTPRIRTGRRVVPFYLRASGRPLPGTDKRSVTVTVQRRERGRFVTRGGGTINLALNGRIEFTLPNEMRGARDVWRMRIAAAKTTTSRAARSGWFYVRVR